MPNNQEQKFTTNDYSIEQSRVIFTDKFNNEKNFPESACFIEGVDQ